MPQVLPRLRLDLDFMPSRDPARPGLMIRDRYRYSESVLIVPPPLVQLLACFDGEQTDLDLRSGLVRATGRIDIGAIERDLTGALSNAGFLEDERFEQMRERSIEEFRLAETREPSHAGAAYPDDPSEANEELSGYMRDAPHYAEDSLIGIAAPHVSPFGGWESYRDAYAALKPVHKDKTFVVLGTSHYGEADCFGLTRKPYVTPFGRAVTDTALVDELEAKAPGSIRMEDYCHSIEHSIEFQVLFLQHVLGPEVRILPILCGQFARSLYQGGHPEDDDQVRRFFGVLGDLAARESGRLMWVLGVDMAHKGRNYRESLPAIAHTGSMLAVEERDRERIGRVNQSDASGFWSLVQENSDDLNWCGSAPIYTFLSAVPGARGVLRRYQQWNIDEQSVVSFAAIGFHSAGEQPQNSVSNSTESRVSGESG